MYGQLSTEYFDIVKSDPLELPFYEEILKGTTGSILYAMCGSGRLFLPLFSKGYAIEGLDYSASMLERCRQQGQEQGLNPVLYQQSFTKMSLEKKYDVMLILGGSFQHIYPRESAFNALQAAKDHLTEGGRLIIDSFVPWEFLYEDGEEEKFAREVLGKDGASIKVVSSSRANKLEQYFISHNYYEKVENGRVIATEEEKMPVLWYYHYEMLLLLQAVGFKDVKVYDTKIGKHPELTVYEAIL